MQGQESGTATVLDEVGSRRSRGEAPGALGGLSWSRTAAVALVVVLLGGAAGCSSHGTDAAASTPARDSSGAGSVSPSDSPSPSPSPSVASPSPTGGGPTPTPGPSAVPKVSRPGQPSKPTITAPPATFSASVSYSDGVTVRVDKVTPGVETGQGPGVFAGREFAVFAVTLHNGTRKPIDVQSVVVTSTYGKRGFVAERVYAAGTGAVDFGGQVAPGADARARYAFAVPTKQLGDVRLVVDFDGTHTSAEFDGDARKAS